MKLIQLGNDSFIRFYQKFGYLVNQTTRLDHLFDQKELVYLKPITRQPQTIDSILSQLKLRLKNCPEHQVEKNFLKLVTILKTEKFIVTGKSKQELEARQANIYSTPIKPLSEKPSGVPIDSARYFAAYFAQNPTVFAMQMDLTTLCNHHCLHCYYPPNRELVELDTKLAFEVLDQLPEMGTLSLTISGGEPFLHKDIDKILYKAREQDLTITIQTNGTVITDEHIELLKEINVNTVQMSIFSLEDKVHDSITAVDGSLQKMLLTIEKLQQAHIQLYISCPIMKQNRHSYQSVLQWAAKRNIKAVTDFIMLGRINFETDNLQHSLDIDDIEAVIGEMLSYGDHYLKSVESNKKDIPSHIFADKPVCGIGIDCICLSAYGNYYPCSGFIGYNLGNAQEVSLQDLWHKSDKLQHLRAIRWSDFPDCLKCKAFQFCSMCFARNFNENQGNLYKQTQKLCDVSFVNKALVEEYWKSDKG